VLALGFGVFLMGTLYQVQYNILRSLDLRLGEARQCRLLLRRSGESASRNRFDHPRGARGVDRRNADRRDAVASINGKSATAIADRIDKNRRLRDSARIAAGRGRGGRGAAARWCAIDGGRGSFGASSGRPFATR
jgi:hypothetical protein